MLSNSTTSLSGFYEFRSPESRSDNLNDKALWNDQETFYTGEGKVRCPANDGHNRGSPLRSHTLSVLFHKRPLKDIMWTVYGECLVQPNVIEIFKENEVTGVELRPARSSYLLKANTREIDDRAPATPPFFELRVTGWGGIAPGTQEVKLCDVCNWTKHTRPKSIKNFVDPKQWDGSDIFWVFPFPNFYFVTARVARILREHRLEGFRLTPLEELDLYGDGKPISPGALSFYMSPELAKKRGEPYGIH